MHLLSDINRQCKIKADKMAFVQNDRMLNYRDLKRQTDRVSAMLQHCLQSGQHRVAIALDRGIDAAVAVLGTLKAGACYIPLDPKNPEKRLQYIVSDAEVCCVIGQGECPEWLLQPSLWRDIEKLPEAANEQTPSLADESLAAILYTSGSTGTPKGVALSHRAMRNFATWAAQTFDITDSDQIASLSPFYFDLSVFDLFSSLSQGASVHFIPSMLTLSPSRLTAWLREHKISVWYTVPSILSFIALKGSLSTTPLPDLKTVLFAGEVFPSQQLIDLCTLLPDTEFFNLYGPTETNVCCYWPVQRRRLRPDKPIPIGNAACASQLVIDNESGELKVKSPNNLSGYWHQGKLLPALSEDLFFNTGDKVSINEFGEYCYHGRLDRMLKCSGHRVEPAEIEQAIRLCPEVENCAVIGIDDCTSGQRPAAAIILKGSANMTDIIQTIRQLLPAYMHPIKYAELKSLPYLANGKIDYQSLQSQLEKQ